MALYTNVPQWKYLGCFGSANVRKWPGNAYVGRMNWAQCKNAAVKAGVPQFALENKVCGETITPASMSRRGHKLSAHVTRKNTSILRPCMHSGGHGRLVLHRRRLHHTGLKHQGRLHSEGRRRSQLWGRLGEGRVLKHSSSTVALRGLFCQQ